MGIHKRKKVKSRFKVINILTTTTNKIKVFEDNQLFSVAFPPVQKCSLHRMKNFYRAILCDLYTTDLGKQAKCQTKMTYNYQYVKCKQNNRDMYSTCTMNSSGTIYKPTTQSVSIQTRTIGKLASFKPHRMIKIKRKIIAVAKLILNVDIDNEFNIKTNSSNIVKRIKVIGKSIIRQLIETPKTETYKIPLGNESIIDIVKKANFCRANNFQNDDSNITILEAEILTVSIMNKNPVMSPEQLIERYGPIYG